MKKRTDRALNVMAWCYRWVNRLLPWHRIPKILGIGNLVALRHDLRRWNLFDTGPLVALLDRSESNHRKCAGFFRLFSGEIFTTEPVLTEAV